MLALFLGLMLCLFPMRDAHCISQLTMQDYDVREFALSMAGRLSEKNPAYVLPALRRHLIQLLTYLDQRLDLMTCH